MGFIFSGLFWGIILILLGISVIINIVFHIHVPFFRIILAVILIYAGVRVLTGGNWGHGRCGSMRSADRAVFCDGVFNRSSGGEHTVVFGKDVIDAEAVFSEDPARTVIKVNTIFGHSVVLIPKTMPIVIRVSSAFSGVRLPDGSVSAFGTTVYKNDAGRAASDASAIKTIDLNVVFGGCAIEER
jgi:predicted membrane protein